MSNSNYFDYQTVAQRYARYRPYFHPRVIAKIGEWLGVDAPQLDVLDVASGTGQSSTALEPIAKRIVGVEISRGMLDECPPAAAIEYVQGQAERLPFVNDTFDLVTVALAFHWFDQARFLSEVRRTLRPRGWLVLYNNGFTGAMRENPDYQDWMREVYSTRFPVPPRHSEPLTPAAADAFDLEFVHQERFTNDVTLTPPALAHYLTTQSNVVAAVEQGVERLEEVYRWLLESIAPLFKASQGTFVFAGRIDALRSTI